MNRRAILVSALILLPLLAGCVYQDTTQQVQQRGEAAAATSAQAKAVDTVAAGQVRTHHRAFAGGHAVLNIHGDPLPPSADHFTLNSKGITLELRDIGTEISAQTRLAVDVLDDAPQQTGGPAGGENGKCRMAPAFDGHVTTFLDALATWCDLTWTYREGRLRLQTFETATYRFYADPTSSTVKTAMESTGTAPTSNSATSGATQSSTGGGGASSGQSLDQTVSISADVKTWDELQKILTIMAKPGVVEISPTTRTVVVIAKHSAQTAIKNLIGEINRRQIRQVVFDVKILEVTISNDVDLGLSLTAALNNLQSGKYKISAATPTSLTMTGAGSLALTVSKDTASGANSPGAVVSALQTLGKVSTDQDVTVTTLDGRPVPVTVARQLGYIANTQFQTATTLTSGPTVTMQQATLTIGLEMQLMPVVLDDGQVLLQYGFGLSTLNALNTVTAGDTTVQTPDINVRSSMQQAVVSSGDSLVLLGYQQDQLNQQDQGIPGLADSLAGLLGGSKTVANTRSSLVIVITPQLQRNGVSGE